MPPRPAPAAPRDDLTVLPWLATAVVVVVVLATTLLVLRTTRDREVDAARDEVAAVASTVRSQLEQAIAERTVLADALAAFVRTDPDFSEAAFHRFARELRALQPDVRALQLAPDAVITYVEPEQGNRAAIGLDLRAYGLQRDVVLRAIESDRFVVGGPVGLVQGGSGMIARLAISVDDDGDPSTDETFWGLAQVVMDTDAVLAAGGIEDATDIDIALRGVDGLGADGEAFRGDPDGLDDPVRLGVSLPGGSWELSAVPRSGWPRWSATSTLLATLGLLLAAVGGALTWVVTRQPARLRREVARATADARASRERIAGVMNTARDAIVEVAADLRIIDGNPAATTMFRREASRLVGVRLTELLAEVPPGQRRFTCDGLRRGGERFVAEVTVDWQSDGSTATVVVRDVTEQQRAAEDLERHTRELERLNEELTRVDAMKRDFIGMASHEVRTPITAIRGFSVTLAKRWDDLSEADRRRCFDVIHRQTERLWRLVDDLLVASSIESGTLAADRLPIDVGTTLRRAIDDAGIARGDTVLTCPAGLEVVVAREHLQRILTSFLNNAAKYGRPPVEVTAALADGHLTVVVRDRGDGVAPAFRDVLFESFTQASTGSTRTSSGTGLGLAVARGLAESVGGRVWYEDPVGGGALFGLQVPAAVRTGDDEDDEDDRLAPAAAS